MTQIKPTVAIHKFSSCDGCQLTLLNMEDDLLALAELVDIAFFLEASRTARPGPYDISLIEGSVTTEHEVSRLQKIRSESTKLIALGTCATAGGIQALRNFADADAFASAVYPNPGYLHYLKTSKPISEYVKTDLELWGCPVNKAQVVEVIVAILANRRPNLPSYAVCMECKRRGASCVMVDSGVLCLGPATQAGCGALCPAMRRGCYGCFGPARQANADALKRALQRMQKLPGDSQRLFRGISGYAAPFRSIADEIVAEGGESK